MGKIIVFTRLGHYENWLQSRALFLEAHLLLCVSYVLTLRVSFSPQREIIAWWPILPKLTPKQCRWIKKTTGNNEAGSILCSPEMLSMYISADHRYVETLSSVFSFILWQLCAYALFRFIPKNPPGLANTMFWLRIHRLVAETRLEIPKPASSYWRS